MAASSQDLTPQRAAFTAVRHGLFVGGQLNNQQRVTLASPLRGQINGGIKNPTLVQGEAVSQGTQAVPVLNFASLKALLQPSAYTQTIKGNLQIKTAADAAQFFSSGQRVLIQGNLDIQVPLTLDHTHITVQGNLQARESLTLKDTVVWTQKSNWKSLHLKEGQWISEQPLNVTAPITAQGQSLLASGGAIQLNQPISTPQGQLSVVTPQSIQLHFKSAAPLKAFLWAGENTTVHQALELQGSIMTRGDLTVNAPLEVAQNPDLSPKVSEGILRQGEPFEGPDGMRITLPANVPGPLPIKIERFTRNEVAFLPDRDAGSIWEQAEVFYKITMGNTYHFRPRLTIELPAGDDRNGLGYTYLTWSPRKYFSGPGRDASGFKQEYGLGDIQDGFMVLAQDSIFAEGVYFAFYPEKRTLSPQKKAEVLKQDLSISRVRCRYMVDGVERCDPAMMARAQELFDQIRQEYAKGIQNPDVLREFNALSAYLDFVPLGSSPCRDADTGGVAAGYGFAVCLNAEGELPPDLKPPLEDTMRHEMGHQYQKAAGVRSPTPIVEGTASNMMRSRDGEMGSYPGYEPFPVTAALDKGCHVDAATAQCLDDFSYETQDFWTYAGKKLQEAGIYSDPTQILRDFYSPEKGVGTVCHWVGINASARQECSPRDPNTDVTSDDLDRFFKGLGFADGYGGMYWDFVKNQLFENTIPVHGGSKCTLNEKALGKGADGQPMLTSLSLNLSSGQRQCNLLGDAFTIPALSARAVRIKIDGPLPAGVNFKVAGQNLRYKAYPLPCNVDCSALTDGGEDGLDFSDLIPGQEYLLIIANVGFSGNVHPELCAEPKAGGGGGDPSDPPADPNNPAEPDPALQDPPQAGTGASFGDPHLKSFDGWVFDFQAVGEFILSKSTDPSQTPENQFEIQTRYLAGNLDYSLTRAVAMQVGQDRVGFYAGQDGYPVVKINGRVQNMINHELYQPLNFGGLVVFKDKLGTVTWLDGTSAEIDLYAGNWGSVSVNLPGHRKGKVAGLLGNFDGQHNDFVTREGLTFATSNPTLQELYGQFGESWRVRDGESLFDYEAGENTHTFTNRLFPRDYMSTAKLDPEKREAAYQTCVDAGIISKVLLVKCTIDVATTGDPGWAYIVAGVDPNVRQISLNPLKLDLLTGSKWNVGAVVSGKDLQSRRVTWNATAGTLNTLSDNSVEYTAPSTPGSYTLTATSVEDHSLQASIPVTVRKPTLQVTGKVRLVLRWGERPSDLDSYLFFPESNPYVVFYNNMGTEGDCHGATLDVDDTYQFGPEVVHLSKRIGQGQYQYWINNYYWFEGPLTNAVVQVIDETGMVAEIKVPENQQGTWWHVLNLDSETGQLALVNKVGNFAGPYTSFTLDCPGQTGFLRQGAAKTMSFTPGQTKPTR
ncbi:VWD domain-containing protein [Deinococcus cellulosilyticus]|uniref:VWFD domain-containing protein n=1 Tax=Deinococcus cellulosilyticus (strain DSM 18568 / NBRC 106333 / KACC 11606 / 5516J-15) TaxID=1223518 RepID=A0A511MZH0_DEIC1|nr:VWD domain-containing protein [Deinococcus cellulosilyticus]GEM45516.1 hypothetical protein DC3_11510 [Deinococcus cellulosilyticus NBRC 106333 = KACC 11606]